MNGRLGGALARIAAACKEYESSRLINPIPPAQILAVEMGMDFKNSRLVDTFLWPRKSFKIACELDDFGDLKLIAFLVALEQRNNSFNTPQPRFSTCALVSLIGGNPRTPDPQLTTTRSALSVTRDLSRRDARHAGGAALRKGPHPRIRRRAKPRSVREIFGLSDCSGKCNNPVLPGISSIDSRLGTTI
jgi:hypothetical protein